MGVLVRSGGCLKGRRAGMVMCLWRSPARS
jgi:hypothetical protein